MKSFIKILFVLGVIFALGFGALYFFSSPQDMATVESVKDAQFPYLTRSLGNVVTAHPRARGAVLWEKKENGTFFATVDIGNQERVELVFRVQNWTTVSVVRARILTPKKIISCPLPSRVLEAMDNGTSFSDTGCEEQIKNSSSFLDKLFSS